MIEEINTIPLEKILEVIRFMEHGSVMRVMFIMLTVTGCRISELKRMHIDELSEDGIYWKLGKNQKNFRFEKLPRSFIEEIIEMRKNNKCDRRLFPISGDTFVHYFNRNIRPKLSPCWTEKIRRFHYNRIQNIHKYSLRLLRKNYQTLLFKKFLDKFNGHYDIALQFTSRSMKHSSTRMTAYHYLQGLDSLNDHDGKMPSELISGVGHQTKLLKYV